MSTHRHIKIIEVGNAVKCDCCCEDYTERDDTGGFMFGSYAYCPACAKDRMPKIIEYGEQDHIKAWCPDGMPFRLWVMQLRNGNNQIRIITTSKGEE